MTHDPRSERVAAVILAAGRSRRFGSAKQLTRIGGRTMLELVVDLAARAGLDPIIAVVPRGVASPPSATAVINDMPEEGLSRSLRMGLGAVPADVDAAVILLGDQPTVRPDHVARLLRARGPAGVVASRSADGVIAPPVLLEREAFGLAASARGDAGLSSVIHLGQAAVDYVAVDAHAPDVDTPADLDALLEACPGCHVSLAPMPEAPDHAYIGASPACWAVFQEVLAREYSDPGYGRMHRHTVDVYAAQHPGTGGRRERQSVALHLIGICHWLEHDLDVAALNRVTQRLASEKRDWPWFEPPDSCRLTVHDVVRATSGDEHRALVRDWASAVWEAWKPHHEDLRRWAAEAVRLAH